LRHTAEAKLAGERATRPSQIEAEATRLQYELEVHQIELELQNQQLRAAQAETAAALDRYTDLFDFAPVGYFNLGSDGSIQLVNLTGAKFTGIERARLIGRLLGLFVAAPDRRAFGDFLAKVFATGDKQTCELALEAEERPPLIVRLEATVTPDGQACRVVMADITDRKRAEKALLANATLTDDVLNSLTDHVVVLDEKGVIIAVNAAWRSFAWKNGSATDYLGENYLTVCHQSVMRGHPAGAAQTETGIRAILDGNLAHFTLEYPCDSPAEARWFRLHVAPLGGEQRGVVISHHDISESRKSEQAVKKSLEALQASKRQFKALFDHAGVGVALADVSTKKFAQVNRRYCEITGYGQAELEQLSFADITHPEDSVQDMEMVGKLQAGTLREYTREKRYLRKDHSEIWVSLTVSAMWAPGETPDFFIAVVQDITSRKHLEEQVRQAQKLDAVGTLAGGIAHDFNNILSAINGYTELSLMTLDKNPQVRAHLGFVLKATARATALVRQILAFSRQQDAARHPIILGPIVAECISLLRATIPTTIEFDTSLAPDAPTVLADATQIHQVLMNLGTNAWHAMKDHHGRLGINLERCVVDAAHAARQARLHPGVYARISVSDTGCGMDQATVLRIFEPFFTTKPVGEGTGLGLAVVHGIMDNHEGAIAVHSGPDKGTVFHLYFPEAIGKPAIPAVAADPVTRGRGERILVVDDEQMIVQITQMTLTELGYETEITTKPADAIAKVLADPGRFALVLTDQTMPGMTGMVLAAQLKQIRPGLPVILTTGYIAALTPAQLKAAGICQLLPKPSSLHAMGAAIHAALAAAK
jgi:PAS domain S-box-containing protein